ncbi:MAG: hypothetical protein ACREI8_15125, partial [Myxococcota bacterium]
MSTSAQCGLVPHDSTRAAALAGLGLALLSLTLYARSIGFEFVDFDDRTVLLAHPRLYDERSLVASLRQIFVDYFPREEPLLLRDLSWALEARLFGFRNPLGYHLGNVLLNAANVALLFLFLRHATRRFWLSLAVATVFAVLPVHVEAVSWVMGRKDVLSTCFVLAALLAQSYELEQTRAARRWSLRLVTLLCTVLALAAKIAAMACVLLLALHRVFHPYLAGLRAPDVPLDWKRLLFDAAPKLLPHAVATAGIVLWYQGVLAQFGVIGQRGPGTFSAEHLTNVAAFVPLVVGSYLRSLVWPVGLSNFYRWPHVAIPLTAVEQLASIGIAAALAVGFAYCCLRRRDLAFFALAFGASLFPYLGFVFVDIWRADRYIYLASFAVVAIAAVLLARLAQRGGRGARLAVAGVSIVFTAGCVVQTLRQQSVWRDNESLWKYEAHRATPSLLSIQALASEYAARAERETDAARRQALIEQARGEVLRGIELERSLGRQPTRYKTSEQLELARLHGRLGRLEAIEGAPVESQIGHYETSYRLAPHRASALALAK